MLPRFRRMKRVGATVIFFAMVLVVLLFATAVAVDLGYIANVRTRLQATADSTALAGASQLGLGKSVIDAEVLDFAGRNTAGSATVDMASSDVEIGLWDRGLPTFTPAASGNAVRTTSRHGSNHNQNGEGRLFFGRLFASGFDSDAVAVAVAAPRDIVFVVDLSGSMNDDTEPAWSDNAITFKYNNQATVDGMFQKLYTDFGFGSFPGAGNTLMVAADNIAYAQYQVNYAQYLVDHANWVNVLMPTWRAYRDTYLITAKTKGSPPWNRGNLPPTLGTDLVSGFNNPNFYTRNQFYNGAQDYNTHGKSLPLRLAKQFNYTNYLQFMLDHARNLKVTGKNHYTPMSIHSPFFSPTSDSVGGVRHSFPARSQPMHAARRAMIAAINIIEDRNKNVPMEIRDWVSVVTYDRFEKGNPALQPVIEYQLNGNYSAARSAIEGIQEAGDKYRTTGTEPGLITARNHIKVGGGGLGRVFSNKVVVLLTDGVPNLWETENSVSNNYITNYTPPPGGTSPFYGG